MSMSASRSLASILALLLLGAVAVAEVPPEMKGKFDARGEPRHAADSVAGGRVDGFPAGSWPDTPNGCPSPRT